MATATFTLSDGYSVASDPGDSSSDSSATITITEAVSGDLLVLKGSQQQVQIFAEFLRKSVT